MEESNNKNQKKKNWAHTIEVAGSELINRIKELIKEGNIRKLIIKKETGEVLLEIPLTAGVAAGGGHGSHWGFGCFSCPGKSGNCPD